MPSKNVPEPEPETFTERFNRLTRLLSNAELQTILQVGSDTAVINIKSGTTKSLKLGGGLRLAKRLGVSPAYLAFGRDDVDMPPGFDQDEKLTTLEAKISDLEALVKKAITSDSSKRSRRPVRRPSKTEKSTS